MPVSNSGSNDEIVISEGTPTTVFILPPRPVEPLPNHDDHSATTTATTTTTAAANGSASTATSTISSTTATAPSSLHVDTVPVAEPVAKPLTFQQKRDAVHADAAQNPAALATLPPVSSTRDRLMLAWRIADASVIFLRPLIFPCIAWLLGRLHLNLLFAVGLAWLWFFSVKNGHLLPRPPPTAQQLQAQHDREQRERLQQQSSTESPTTPTLPEGAAAMADGSGSGSDEDDSSAHNHIGLMSLPGMLSGLTVQYPDWFFYPDVQRTRWINDMLEILWPYVKTAVRTEVDKRAAPFLAMAKGLISITEMDFGTEAPFVGGIKVYDTKDDDTVMLDIDIRLAIEPNICIEARYWKLCVPVRVTTVSAALTARVTLTGLVGKFPCFRRLGIALASKPELMTMVDVLGVSIFDVPILGSYGQHLIEDVAMKMFGWPRELSIPVLVETAAEAAARSKLEPKGLLHVYLMSATNLRNVDTMGKSDPYAKLSIGDQTQTSAVVPSNLNPVWNSDFEFICYEPERETLRLGLYDADVVKVPNPLNSRRLGDVEFPVSSLLQQPFQDVSLPLQHTTKGNVRFQCEWRPFAVRSNSRQRVHHHHADSSSASDSVLFVSALRAIDLPVDNCQLKFVLGNVKRKTALCRARGRECEWEERFSFPVFNPEVEQLTVQLRYDDNAAKLTSFATKHVTLGMKEIKTKSSLLAAITIDVREVARTGHLTNDFPVPLPPGMKIVGKPRLHLSCMLRELAASASLKERRMQAVRSAVPGTLTVQLISASGLVALDLGGKSDPYVTLSVGSQKHKSAVKKKSCDPVWHETQTFRISDLLRDNLEVDVRDWGALSGLPAVGGLMEGIVHRVTMRNDHLGDAHIPLRMLYAQLYDGGVVEKEIPLNHTTKGVIRLGLQFQADDGVPMPPPASVNFMSMPDLLRIGSTTSLGVSSSSISSSSSSLNSLHSRESSLSQLGSSSGLIHSSIAEDGSMVHTTADGKVTDAVGVAPTVHMPLEHATVGVASGLRPSEQMQDQSGDSSAAQSAAASNLTSAASSQPTSGTTTPQRPSSLHTSQLSSQSSSLEPASPSGLHSRQASEGEVDFIHHDPRLLEGYLVIVIHGAQHLPPQHRDGTVSAYVKLSLGKTKVHTAVVTSAQPVWETAFRLPLHAQDAVAPHETALKIRVKRFKKGSWLFGNEVVGDADLVLAQLSSGHSSFRGLADISMDHHEFTLIDPKTNHPQGSLTLSCSFEPAQANPNPGHQQHPAQQQPQHQTPPQH